MNKSMALTALGFATQQDVDISYDECWERLLSAAGKKVDNPTEAP